MARPKRNNADYFSHDAGMRDDPKVKALRNKFGITGYAVWCMMLEILTHSDFFTIQIEELEIEILSADFGIEADLFGEILSYMVKLKLLQTNDNCEYLSQKLTDRLQSVLDKRRNASKNRVTVTESTQSKVKKTKKKENKDIVEKDNIKVTLDYLNEKTGKSFRTAKGLSTRFTEGYTVDDAKKVIDIKCAEWLHDPKMKTFLRPDTLFSGKFDGYLNQEQTVSKFNFDSAEWVTLNNSEKVKVDYDKLVVYDSKGSVHDFLEVDKEGTIFA